jgi:hypothetical protein
MPTEAFAESKDLATKTIRKMPVHLSHDTVFPSQFLSPQCGQPLVLSELKSFLFSML